MLKSIKEGYDFSSKLEIIKNENYSAKFASVEHCFITLKYQIWPNLIGCAIGG